MTMEPARPGGRRSTVTTDQPAIDHAPDDRLRIVRYLADDLPDPAERRAAAAHLAGCPSCARQIGRAHV